MMALPAWGVRRVTVAQLQQDLTAEIAANHADADIARRIGQFEMTEQLTDRSLGRFAATLKLEPRTALALQLLADQSAFFDPPQSELPATGAPDAATQQHMLDAARAYAVAIWSRMPNFFVTRVTHRFDDTPHVPAQGSWPVDMGLQPAGSSSRQIAFHDGKEVQDPTVETAGSDKSQELGLRSWGEFGPAVTVVLADLANQKVAFSHWEQTAAGLAAVYRYAVPKDASHYAVAFCCVVNQEMVGHTQYGLNAERSSLRQMANLPRQDAIQTWHETPGYHGTIAIDSASGAVLRLTIEAELSGGDPLLRAETLVEYGPVQIGERQFLCPTRSLAISMEQAAGGTGKTGTPNPTGNESYSDNPLGHSARSTVLLINETHFQDYHRLGTTMRILADTAGGRGETPSSETPAPAAEAAGMAPNPGATAANQPVARADNSNQQTVQVAASAGERVASDAAPANLSPPAEPVIPEISLTAANGVPDQPANEPQPADSGYSLKVTSRLVDVGLVAYDKKGHPVTDLNPGEIEVYDNGRKVDIHSFGLAAGASPPAPVAEVGDSAPEVSFSNRAVTGANAAPLPAASGQEGSTVLLIDESHIAWSDLNYARAQILAFLGSLKPGERVGIYSMNGLGFRVLTEVTTDHAALIGRMQKFLPTAQAVAQANDEETRNRQHFDEVHNISDLNSVNGNHTDVPDFITPTDPQLMTMGDDPVRASFVVLAQVARHLSSLSGPKKLVWVSSDNVFADWRDQTVGIEKSPKPVEGFASHAQEAMNEAHAAVYPFDVSQLEAAGVSADLQHQNVQLTAAAAETASLGGGNAMSRSTNPGRIAAEMSQDIHPVQVSVREVAAATGGRVIRRTGNLAGQLDEIVADGDATYMLSFSPEGPADGQYHKIALKLTGHKGLTLSYRTGYLFDKEPSTLHERFQQAVWRPMDVSEIAVTANVAPGTGRANVKINIAASDLAMEQQAGRWMDKLDIFFIQRDDAGLHARVEGQTLGLRLKSQTYQRLLTTGVPFEHAVVSPAGLGSLRVLVVDENSGHMGSVTIPGTALNSGR